MDSTKTLRQQAIARMRELCEERGLGFDELASEIGVEPGLLEEIGRGERAIDSLTLRRAARALDCQMIDFFTREKPDLSGVPNDRREMVEWAIGLRDDLDFVAAFLHDRDLREQPSIKKGIAQYERGELVDRG